jgi:hypothetical protein
VGTKHRKRHTRVLGFLPLCAAAFEVEAGEWASVPLFSLGKKEWTRMTLSKVISSCSLYCVLLWPFGRFLPGQTDLPKVLALRKGFGSNFLLSKVFLLPRDILLRTMLTKRTASFPRVYIVRKVNKKTANLAGPKDTNLFTWQIKWRLCSWKIMHINEAHEIETLCCMWINLICSGIQAFDEKILYSLLFSSLFPQLLRIKFRF